MLCLPPEDGHLFRAPDKSLKTSAIFSSEGKWAINQQEGAKDLDGYLGYLG